MGKEHEDTGGQFKDFIQYLFETIREATQRESLGREVLDEEFAVDAENRHGISKDQYLALVDAVEGAFLINNPEIEVNLDELRLHAHNITMAQLNDGWRPPSPEWRPPQR